MRLLFGSKSMPRKEEAFQILNAIDKVDKLIPKYRNTYDILSEFVHPNCAGTFISFGKLDKENVVFYYGKDARNNTITNGLGVLNGALLLTLKINKDIENVFANLVKLCEEDISQNNQHN